MRQAQVVIEMLLILPVFLTIVFSIMELGYIAFQMILLNHATYEVARVGGMTYGSPGGEIAGGCGRLEDLMKKMLHSGGVSCQVEETLTDNQAKVTNKDLVVTGHNRIKLIFPISSLILSKPLGSGYLPLAAVVRMPIEQPLAQ